MSEEKNENLTSNQEVPIVDDTIGKTEKLDNKDKKVDEPTIVESLEDTSEDDLVEQLSVIKEVRDELANAYKTSKENQKVMEQLQSQIDSLSIEKKNTIKTIESLSKELEVYKTREVEADNIAYNKRLEQLSSDFKELGQEKTVEQLSTLPRSVISEFETITKTAISHKTSEQLDSVTVPSQSMGEKKMEETNNEPTQKKEFSFADLCGKLTKQQQEDGSNSKRTINM